ncbi:hypothetical protein GGU11DRAFT_693290 [Lentinula aff. detonsa]|nr:hypothetical protein GGU11DRAFT_693290 [Lentinula aff. detonsa]
MEEGDRLKKFTTDWGTNATAQPTHHEVIAEFVPTTMDIEATWTWETITRSSQLPKNAIVAARWQKPGQKVAHAIFAFADMRVANRAIQGGMVVDHKMVSVRREEKDPQRCMKCQQYGHIARECKSNTDVCGRCEGAHPTQTCSTKPENFYCTVCKTKGHVAADRTCPTLLRRLRERQQRDPTKGFRYFVTEDEDTWDKNGNDLAQETEWRDEVRKSYKQGWTTVQ